ncbi:hypothetical protein PIB30_098672 [Stylosanthes scabra]|uniref:Uncharacterized protein n=1 Tax=Stylosanthes scabra TaxID=79078 RepID=A0ABU6YUC4_9FABA|nr:hypothetical protein [Stylosanthes scabra]
MYRTVDYLPWLSRAGITMPGGDWPSALDWTEFKWRIFVGHRMARMTCDSFLLTGYVLRGRYAPGSPWCPLCASIRGEDVWWPTHHTTRAWYESWMRYAAEAEGLLQDQRVVALPADIHPTPSQSRPDIPFLPNALTRRCHQGGRVGHTRGASCRDRWRGEAESSKAGPSRQTCAAHMERFDDECEEERLFDQYETLGDSPIRYSDDPPPPHLSPSPPPP